MKPCTPAPRSTTGSPPSPPHKPSAEVRHSFFALPGAAGQPSKACADIGAAAPAPSQQAAHAQHEAPLQTQTGQSASREEAPAAIGAAQQPFSNERVSAGGAESSGGVRQQQVSATSAAAAAAHPLGLQTGLSLLDTQNLDEFSGMGEASQAQAGRLPAFHTAMSMLSTMGSVGTFAGPIAAPAWDSDEDDSHRGSASDDAASDAGSSSDSDDMNITFSDIHAPSRAAAGQLGTQGSAAAQAAQSMLTARRLAQEAQEEQARLADAALQAGKQQREASAATGSADTRPVFMKALQILHSGKPAEQPIDAAGQTKTADSPGPGLQTAIGKSPPTTSAPAAAQSTDTGLPREQHAGASEDKASAKLVSAAAEASGSSSDTTQAPVVREPSAGAARAAAGAGHSHAAGLHMTAWNAAADPGQPGGKSSVASRGARRSLKGPSRLSAAAKPFIPGQAAAPLGRAPGSAATFGSTAKRMGPPIAQSRSSVAESLPQTDAAQEKGLPSALSAGAGRQQAPAGSAPRSASPFAAEAGLGNDRAGPGTASRPADSVFRSASRFSAEAGPGCRHMRAGQPAGPASSSSVAPSMPATAFPVIRLPASSSNPTASVDSLPPAAGSRPASEMRASHGRAGLGTPAPEVLPGTLSNAEELVHEGDVASMEVTPSHNPCQKLDFGREASKVSPSVAQYSAATARLHAQSSAVLLHSNRLLTGGL